MKIHKYSEPGRWTHIAFDVGLIIKGVDSVLELAGGILLLFISPARLTSWLVFLTNDELSEDPHDRIATYFFNLAHRVSIGNDLFGAIYLISHGLVKIILIIAMFKRRLWAKRM